MPANDEFVPNDDFDQILRSNRRIEESAMGPTPNEVSHGLAKADITISESVLDSKPDSE